MHLCTVRVRACHGVVTCHRNFGGRRCTHTDVNPQVLGIGQTCVDPCGRRVGPYGSEGSGDVSRTGNIVRIHADSR